MPLHPVFWVGYYPEPFCVIILNGLYQFK
jgi:hypothetical protein